MNKSNARRSAFTLIEVLLVLVILGLLASVAVLALGGVKDDAQKDTTKSLIHEVTVGLDLYNMKIGHYPTQEEGGLDALRTKPAYDNEEVGDKWSVLLKRDPVDAWHNKLNYEPVSAEEAATLGGAQYKVWSNGPDGQSGTDDDINSWTEAKAS